MDIERINKEVEENYKAMIAEKRIFQYVEIETINRCNGECLFCPVNKHEPQREYKMMQEELFSKIIGELRDVNYKGELGLFSNNEPFLDSRIISFAEEAYHKLPNAYIYLYTNGTLLDSDKYSRIMPYLAKMQIDVYSFKDGEEPKNIKRIREVAEKKGYSQKTFIDIIRPDLVRYSRGGDSPNSKVDYVTEELCRLPFVQMVIRPDGKVSLCCNDPLGKETLGDVTKNSLMEIWEGEKFNQVRQKMLMGRENLSHCKFCNTIDRRDFVFDRNRMEI